MTLLPVLAAAATFCLTWHGAYAADVKFSGSDFIESGLRCRQMPRCWWRLQHIPG